MNIQLSISLLASDRAASLERCLDSLQPLLMQVPSELIIIFTGTDTQVRDIAARYTDQIIPFTWCNDFSKARNIGLNQARGEWFMYIDDDEWFEDTAEIRDFFLSGEYRKYHSACYKQRNYTDWAGIRHSDFHAFRMSRNSSGLRFINPIHEQMSPWKDPCKYFDDYVHHFGYVRDNVQYMVQTKVSRNIPMLLDDIQKHPLYIKNYIQLIQEYFVDKDWTNAEKYCRKGRTLKADVQERCWLQVSMGEILCKKGDAEQAICEIKTILEKEKTCELAKLNLYCRLITLYQEQEDPENILYYGQQFEKLLSYMDKNPHLWIQQALGNINESKIKNPDNLPIMRINCTDAALKLSDSRQAACFLKLLPWNEEHCMQKYYPLFDQWMTQYDTLLHDILEELPAGSPYIQFQKALVLDQEKEPNAKLKMFFFCLDETGSSYLQQQIIKETLFLGDGLDALVKKLDLDTWKLCTARLIDTLSLKVSIKIRNTIDVLRESSPIYGYWLSKLIYEKELIRGCLTGQNLMNALANYCQNSLQFYKEQYREEMFMDENHNLLPQDCQFVLLVSEGLKMIELMKLPEAIKSFRLALQYYPEMTGVLHEVIRLLVRYADNPIRSTEKEFLTLAGQMKEALNGMIEKRQFNEALSLVTQLSPLLPEDLDLLRMKQKILRQICG
ncbi:MAG: glycosyltransferase [Ruminococcus sp.]|jgi:glycosyltransferase involved in cell wall biosynthesis|nr:glycosyltransferase [Ruminococcus sp.]